MRKCPHCGETCMTRWEKSCLGAGRSVSCPHCHEAVGLSSAVAIAFIPLLAAGVGSPAIPSWWGFVAVLGGGLLTLYLQIEHVPLWKAGPTGLPTREARHITSA